MNELTQVSDEARFAHIIRVARWIELSGVLLGLLTTYAIERHVTHLRAERISELSGITGHNVRAVALVCLLMAVYNVLAWSTGHKRLLTRSSALGIAIDLAFVTGVIAPTLGLQSLFFGLFYFVIIGTAMWSGMRGALLTAGASLVCVSAVEFGEIVTVHSPHMGDVYTKLGAPDVFARLPYLFLVAWMTGAVTDAFRRETERRLSMERRASALRIERERMEQEMEAARAVQRSLLPSAPPEAPGLSVAFRYQPAGAVGGDIYDFVALAPRETAFMVADVSGHSLPAALLVAAAKGALYDRLSQPPAEMMGSVNRRLVRDTGDDRFVTMVYACVSLDPPSVRWVNAGHPAPLLLRAGEAPALLEGHDAALGVVASATYTERTQPLQTRDVILLYSDGLVERDRREGGVSGYHEFMAAMDGLRPDNDVEAIADAVLARSDEMGEARDDVALVVVKVNGPARTME
ncbi:MAG TPA: PP2C family protein-serine/threonine phosphatase [Armatimonadota bacterium]